MPGPKKPLYAGITSDKSGKTPRQNLTFYVDYLWGLVLPLIHG